MLRECVMRILLSVAVILVVSFCCRAGDDVGVGENKELVIAGHVSVPVPDSSWDWYVGNTIVKEGMKISVYWCQSKNGGPKIVLLVFHERLKDDKKKFAKEFVDVCVGKAKKEGFKLEDNKMEEKDAPWKGSLHYSGVLRKGDTTIYLRGVLAFGKAIYALQYQGPDKSFDFFDKVSKGMRLLSKGE